MNRIEDIRLFLRVLDLGSISAAARTLDLSAAVASQRLKRLEEALGVRLLQRSTRQLKVTPEGAALAERGRPLIEDLEALTSGLREAAEDVSGTLRVTLPAAFGRQYISPLMPEFLARHPRLRLSLDLSDAMQDLVAEGFDLGLRIGTLDDSTLIARRLTDNRRVLCAAPGYLDRRGVPETPADLEQHDCLLMVGAKGARDRWTLISPDGSETTVRARGRFESNMGEVVRDAVLAGLGISLHSTWHVCDDLRAGRLKLVLPGYRIPDSAIYAVMPQRRLMLPRVRAFIDFIVEKFGDVPPWERVSEAP
jgi:DNA-binding transcriptional LysR family regulator